MVPVISLRNDIKVIFNCQNLQSLHLHLSLISNSWHLLAEYHKFVQNLPTWLRGSRKPFHHFIKFHKGQFSLNLRLCFCNQLIVFMTSYIKYFFIRFGFVEMGSVRGAERAVRGLDGTQVWGKQVFWPSLNIYIGRFLGPSLKHISFNISI